MVLEKLGKPADALSNYNRVLQMRPAWAGALSHVAVVLATQKDPQLRNTDEALRLAQKAVSITEGKDPAPLDALARVYAELGRFTEAADVAERAAQLTSESGDAERANELFSRVRIYRARAASSETGTN